ncbi:MAG: chain-length determining protein, partial [Burkholderiales bacterium]|nr:chain-length determining protein [Burkholderiales bacterium]
MKPDDLSNAIAEAQPAEEDFGPSVSLVDLLTWVGEGKWLVARGTALAALASIVVALLLPPIFTARTTLLPPASQQSGGASAALAALGAVGGLSGLSGGLGAKSPDELFVALLKSDSVLRALDARFDLKARYEVKTYEELRKSMPDRVRVASDRKSGVISVEVDDKDSAFAADLANAHATEITKLLGRLAVSEAQLRRVFFEQQLKDIKENLIKAELGLRAVQEKSGVIVLDKQAEALIGGAAQLRAMIAERDVQLKVLRTAATGENPDVLKLNSELAALRFELARMESARGPSSGSAVEIPVGKIPEAAIEYVRARRELKLQETLLESMVRQFEIAKLDEAKEGPVLQQVDKALPPDRKSKPSRALIVIASTLLALLASMAFVVWRRYAAAARE